MRFDYIESKREIDLLINRQVVEGVKQNDDLQDMRIKDVEQQYRDLENRVRDLEIIKKIK